MDKIQKNWLWGRIQCSKTQWFYVKASPTSAILMATDLFHRTLHCSRISRRILSQLSMNTMDATTFDRSVRRPRIRTESMYFISVGFHWFLIYAIRFRCNGHISRPNGRHPYGSIIFSSSIHAYMSTPCNGTTTINSRLVVMLSNF